MDILAKIEKSKFFILEEKKLKTFSRMPVQALDNTHLFFEFVMTRVTAFIRSFKCQNIFIIGFSKITSRHCGNKQICNFRKQKTTSFNDMFGNAQWFCVFFFQAIETTITYMMNCNVFAGFPRINN